MICRRRSARQPSSGSALVIVLVLLGIMATLLISNGITLRRLRVELELLEQKQQRALQERTSALPTSGPQTSDLEPPPE